MAHEDCEETESVGCWFNGKIVDANECEVGVECGAVIFLGGGIDGLPQSKGTLMKQAFSSPSNSSSLLGLHGRMDHKLVTPNSFRISGGEKRSMTMFGTSSTMVQS